MKKNDEQIKWMCPNCENVIIPVPVKTVGIRTAKRILKEEKKKWLKETYSAADLKRIYKFKDSEIKKIKSIVRYNKKRYTREDILEILK